MTGVREAQWLSDLSLRNSQCNGDDGIEAMIMRLSSHPELLHHFLNVNPDPALMSAISPTTFNVTIDPKRGYTASIGGNGPLSKAVVYGQPGTRDDLGTSLEPLTFFPTNDDTHMAIDAEILSESPGDSGTSSRKPRQLPLSLVVALSLAVMLMGLFALA